MMKKQSKVLSWFMAVMLFLSMLNTSLLRAEDTVIVIQTVEDLKTLAKNCTLDTWSQGKVVKLAADLDVSNSGFTSIPTFGGTFEGSGHCISGFSITGSGSIQGLFRYVEQHGRIKDVTVKGNIMPAGTKNIIGGIAGKNSGVIKNSVFIGNIKGENDLGGMAGINEATGEIIGCTAIGQISGTHYVGGMVGENLGTILDSKNKMSVNISENDTEITLEDLENINLQKINSTENTTAITDVGGIAGFSTGILQGCENYETVGYQHIGYNIGGIVGRQSGYINSCTNYAEVYGRKDVGGIVGQLEPYITLDFSEDQISSLRDELNKLRNLFDQTISDADGFSSDMSNGLDETKGYVDQALDSTTSLLDQTQGLYNEGIDSINNMSARVMDTLDKLSPVLEEAEDLGDKMNQAINQLEKAVSTLEVTNEDGEKLLSKVKEEMNQLKDNIETFSDDIKTISKELQNLRNSLGEEEAMNEALEELMKGLLDMSDSIEKIGRGFKEISDTMGQLKEDIGENWRVVREDISKVGEALVSVGKAIRESVTALKSAKQDIKSALNTFLKAQSEINAALSQVHGLIEIDKIQAVIKDFLEAMEDVPDMKTVDLEKIEDLSDDTADDIDAVLKQTSEAIIILQKASVQLQDIIQDTYDIISNLASKPNLILPNIDSSYETCVNGLTSNLSSISNSLGSLNAIMNSGNERILSDLKKLSSQFQVVTNLVIDNLSDDDEVDLSSYQQDISDEDTESNTQGKVANSINEGEVQGDLNVGGITGSMAIEYDFDPEDDVAKLGKTSLKFQYLTKAVVRTCTNKGDVASKKDYTGGIVGRMDLGSVIECTGYGKIEGKDGNYVGGIAGASYSQIRDSFSMCSLAGNNHIGGIAGYGTKLTQNKAMIKVERYIEKVGAIAGEVEQIGNQSKNVFVDLGIVGIDEISYSGKAEPISYEELSSLPNIPSEFVSLKLTFIADGQTVEVIPFKFGESLDENSLPKIPQKEGYYGKWPEFDLNDLTFSATIEAVYVPFYTIIASKQTKGDKSLALAEGTFAEDTILNVNEVSDLCPADKNHKKVWNITITGSADDQEQYGLRLLKENNKEKKVYVLQADGGWKKIDSGENGSYLLITMEGHEQTFCIEEETDKKLVLIWAGSMGMLLLIILALVKKRLKSKKEYSV